MHLNRSMILLAAFLSIVLLLSGCATVPKEVVELSYTVGRDLDEVHRSHKALIEAHFDGLRAQTLSFLDNKWQPVYLGKFIKQGGLVDLATQSDPSKAFADVQIWVEVAMDEIKRKRAELLDPIDAQEKELTESVDKAFAQIVAANSTITAHLNSLRKVQEVQDEALAALGLKDLRDKVNDGLVRASNLAKQGIEKVKKAEGIVDNVDKQKKELKGLLPGGNNP